jgi:hypothetical protein
MHQATEMLRNCERSMNEEWRYLRYYPPTTPQESIVTNVRAHDAFSKRTRPISPSMSFLHIPERFSQPLCRLLGETRFCPKYELGVIGLSLHVSRCPYLHLAVVPNDTIQIRSSRDRKSKATNALTAVTARTHLEIS